MILTRKQKRERLESAPKLKPQERLLPIGESIIKVKILTTSPVCMPVVYPRDQWGRRLLINSTVSRPCVCKIPKTSYNSRDAKAGLYRRIRDNTVIPNIINDRHPRTSPLHSERIVKNRWHIEGPGYRFGTMSFRGKGMGGSSIHPKAIIEHDMATNLSQREDEVAVIK